MRIRKWVQGGSPNCIHQLRLAEAETASLDRGRGWKGAADKKYQEALVMAARSGFIQDHALACELYGEFLLLDGCNDKMDAAQRQVGSASESSSARSKSPFLTGSVYHLMMANDCAGAHACHLFRVPARPGISEVIKNDAKNPEKSVAALVSLLVRSSKSHLFFK